jgi:5-methylcytosine-specific restriction endonuclease McrA
MKRTPLNRRMPLKRRGRLNTRRRNQVDRDAAAAWAWVARSQPCAACGQSDRIEGHHVLYAQHVRVACRSLDLDYETWRWDVRNLMPLCMRCHQAHHTGRRLPLELVERACPGVRAFAVELGLEHRLDRSYGEVA